MVKCYMCDAEGTTDEHAPPKCIFPEKKDLPNQEGDYRKQLITVRACELHNTSKSKDDEYLLNILSMNILTNNIGIRQFLTKVQRAWNHSEKLKNAITEYQTPVVIVSENEKPQQSVMLKINGERVLSSMESCARALFFKEAGFSFVGEVNVVCSFLMEVDDIDYNNSVSKIIATSELALNTETIKGENLEVFTYKIRIEDSSAMILMTFYGASKVVAIMRDKNKLAQNA